MAHELVNPRNESPHAPFIVRVIPEFLSQPTFFVPGFGVKENCQHQGNDQCRPALPNERPAHGGTKNGSVKRMPNQSVNAMLNQLGSTRRLWKRGQVSPQSHQTGNAANRGSRKKGQTTDENRKRLRCRATGDAQNGDGKQKQELSNHPPAAALNKAVTHFVGLEFAQPRRAPCGHRPR